MSLKARVTEDMKSAMRAKDAPRLSAIRLLLAAVKQREVDERKELTDAEITAVIEKMLKQRQDSITQFDAAGRDDLASVERHEVEVLSAYMPQALSEPEIDALIAEAIERTGATKQSEMSKVIGVLRAQVAGRANMAQVSALVKSRLAS